MPVRGALIDVDGVLHVTGTPIPGAADALEYLRDRGIPFRLLTNITERSREVLAGQLGAIGFQIAPSEMLTAASSAADLVRRRYPGQPCLLLANELVRSEFAGIPLTNGPEARVVVVGDLQEGFTWPVLNHAFRLLHNGAALVAMHRGRWWMTEDGPTLDAGAFIRGLEYAAGVRATVAGKPSAPFFRAGFRALGLPPSEIVMVGDDIHHDILPAMRYGAQGALVRTGKFRESDLAAGTPNVMLNSIAALPHVLSAE
jgi:HAD superfamily hydrolase (TIGR01458 family)